MLGRILPGASRFERALFVAYLAVGISGCGYVGYLTYLVAAHVRTFGY